MTKPKIRYSISILAMNGLETTRRCIDSVLKHSKNFELLLVDNGSTDGTAEYFESLKTTTKAPVRVTHNAINQGFVLPNNANLQLAQGEYFVCLNNDATVPAKWLQLLEAPFKEFFTAALTGPAGSCCELKNGPASFHGSPGTNLEYIEGSCLMGKTEFLKSHGLFPEFIEIGYGCDVWLSLKLRAQGCTLHLANFQITHERAMTARQIPNIDEIKGRNLVALQKRWGNYQQFKRFDLPFVIRRTDAIGDVLLTTPLIAEIKRQQPTAEIFVETRHPGIFKNNPNVAKAGGPFQEVYRWSNIIDLDGSYESMIETPIQEAYFKTALIEGKPGRPELYPDAALCKQVKSWMGNKKWVAVHVGPTTWVGKNWPWPRWEKLCQYLLEKNWRVLLVGNTGESLPNYLDLRGKTDFQELAAILRNCKLFVGVDSFPLHAARSQETPVIGLFGATSPEYILTGDDYKAVCGTAPCTGERHRISGSIYTECAGACMNSITVEQVIEAI